MIWRAGCLISDRERSGTKEYLWVDIFVEIKLEGVFLFAGGGFEVERIGFEIIGEGRFLDIGEIDGEIDDVLDGNG